MGALCINLSIIGLALQSTAKASDQPHVVAAVGPAYPTVARFLNAKGEVVVEVKIDLKGKVSSASAMSGNEYLRKSSEKAAMEWQFAALAIGEEGPKERLVRLTFSYGSAEVAKPGRTSGELTTVFMPPYRVEVISHTSIMH